MPMTAAELFEQTRRATRAAGLPEWDSPEQGREALRYLDESQGGPVWAITPAVGEVDDDQLIEIDPTLAQRLLTDHLRRWLTERRWQVQLSVRAQSTVWRLADCLSVLDGGGDRLDDDYPSGDDELTVLCAAVRVVATSCVPT